MRTLSAALLLVVLLPVAVWATCTGAQPVLCLSLNRSAFQAGQTLRLTATASPGIAPAPVDVYLALHLPAGTLLFLQDDGTFTTNWTPLATGWTPTSFVGQVFVHTFGSGDPGGAYTWYAAFASRGTLSFIGGIATAPFTFTPPPANVGGTYGLTGTITQTGCGSGFDGTYQTNGQISFSQTGVNLTGSATFTTPLILETSSMMLSGTVNGNNISGSFTSTTNFNGTIGPGMGLFNGFLGGNTLVITISTTVTGCNFTLSMAGNRQ